MFWVSCRGVPLSFFVATLVLTIPLHDKHDKQLTTITHTLTHCPSVCRGSYLLDEHQSGQCVSASGSRSWVCVCQAQWHLSHFGSAAAPSLPPWVPARHFAGAEADRVHDSGRRGTGTPTPSCESLFGTEQTQIHPQDWRGVTQREKVILGHVWQDCVSCSVTFIRSCWEEKTE